MAGNRILGKTVDRDAFLDSYLKNRSFQVYDGREARAIASKLQMHPAELRGKLRTRGMSLVSSPNGSCKVWKFIQIEE